MATDVDIDVATALQAAAVGNYNGVGSKTIFTGPMRGTQTGVPPAAIFVLENAGPQPQAYCGDNTRVVATTPVQVTIRANADAFAAGQATARAVWAALHQKPPTGYIEARAQGDRPNYLGKDESDRHLWTVNLDMEHVRSIT